MGLAQDLLFVNEEPVGVIEAKKVELTLIGVEEQSAKYLTNLPNVLAENTDNLLTPQVLAASIIEDLQAALELFMEIEADMSNSVTLKETATSVQECFSECLMQMLLNLPYNVLV